MEEDFCWGGLVFTAVSAFCEQAGFCSGEQILGSAAASLLRSCWPLGGEASCQRCPWTTHCSCSLAVSTSWMWAADTPLKWTKETARHVGETLDVQTQCERVRRTERGSGRGQTSGAFLFTFSLRGGKDSEDLQLPQPEGFWWVRPSQWCRWRLNMTDPTVVRWRSANHKTWTCN